MSEALPFWMVQRQVKAETVDERTLRLKAPNLPAHEIAVAPNADGSGWTATLYRGEPERREIASRPAAQPTAASALQTGYELFRQLVIC
jgi:hypothetical protein